MSKMCTKHLSIGSVNPPQTKGLLRIYSMRFCPFAARALTVLLLKNVPHEIVNINLDNKPEWYSQIVSSGKVPALVDGSNIIVESLDICDYLDEKYPPALHPKDPVAKRKDKEVLEKSNAAINLFAKCLHAPVEEKSVEEWTRLLIESLQELENELAARGTTFFGGENPAMVDYMIYPFAERSESLTYKFGQKLPIKETDIPHLKKWKKAMFKQPVCQIRYISGEKFWKSFSPKLSNQPQIFDD